MCSVRFAEDSNIGIEEKENDSILLGVISRKYRFLYELILSISNLEKKLLTCIVLGGASFAVTIFIMIYSYFSVKYDSQICVEPGCILSAVRILEGMNRSADPCDDFYEYVCGNWPTQHLNPPDEANSWFLERAKVVNNKIKSLLEAPYDRESIKPIQQMKTFHRLCTDTTNLDRKGLAPIFRILDMLGLPRLLPTAGTAADVNIAKVLSHAQRLLNFDILIQLSIRFNSTSNMNMLSVGPASNDVSFLSKRKIATWNRYKSEMSPEEYLIHQVSYMTAVIVELSNGAVNLDDITREVLKIIFLEAQLKLDVEEASNDEEEYMTLNDLQDFMFANFSPEASIFTFSWKDYFTVLTNNLNVSFNMDSVVHVANPSYFQVLGYNFINLKSINFQRFIWWKVVHAVAGHTTDIMRMHEYIFNQYILRGITQLPTRSTICIELTKTLFTDAIAFKLAFLQNITRVTNNVNSIMSNIKEAFREIITNSAWVDETTKHIAIRKLDAIKISIGYPQHLLNSQWIVERYKKVKIFKNDFIGTLLAMRASLVDDVLLTIHTSEKQNKNYENDKALNYGAIGSILGHELTHGFDSEGKNYDWKGEKRASWSELMTSMYNNRSQCFIDQYSKYSILSNLTVNGNTTLAENIADNGGIKEAFYAYENYVREKGVEKLLPGFENFTHKQLLFMSFGNVWCKQQNEVSLKFSLLDEHSPNKYRVIGSLSNLEEFSRTWNCDTNSKMNPSHRCILW